MFIYYQLLLFFAFYNLDNFSIRTILFIMEFYSLLFYFGNYSYVKIIINGQKSYPKFKNINFKDGESIFVMLNYFNRKIYNEISSKYFYLIDLHYYNSSIKSLAINCETLNLSFSKFPNLYYSNIKRLFIKENKILFLDSNNFPKRLKYLNAKSCDVEKVFIDHDYLKEVDLSFNNMTDIKIKCSNLRKLYLNFNKLQKVEIDCPKLKFLNLSNNSLEEIELNCFLDVLNIESNQFIVLPSNLLNIKRLYLKRNPIIPNLNIYRWNEYFYLHNIEFFQNNIDYTNKNVYQDRELVHNTHINNSIKKCIDELEYIFYSNEIKYDGYFGKLTKKIDNLIIQNNFRVKDLLATILYLAKSKDLLESIVPILEYEIYEGEGYCLSGKIGRILTSIMGFDLISNVITISKNDEIMTKYDLVVGRIKNEFGEEDPMFFYRLRKEFENELVMMGISSEEINEWVSELKN